MVDILVTSYYLEEIILSLLLIEDCLARINCLLTGIWSFSVQMDVVPRATHPSNQWARACYRGLSSKATTSVPGLCGQLSLQPPDSFYKLQWFSFLQALIIKIITQIKKIRKNVPTSMLSRVTQNKVLVCQTRWDCCEHFYASIPIDLKSGCLGSKYHSFSCYNGSKAKPLWPLMDFDPWCFVYLFHHVFPHNTLLRRSSSFIGPTYVYACPNDWWMGIKALTSRITTGPTSLFLEVTPLYFCASFKSPCCVTQHSKSVTNE